MKALRSVLVALMIGFCAAAAVGAPNPAGAPGAATYSQRNPEKDHGAEYVLLASNLATQEEQGCYWNDICSSSLRTPNDSSAIGVVAKSGTVTVSSSKCTNKAALQIGETTVLCGVRVALLGLLTNALVTKPACAAKHQPVIYLSAHTDWANGVEKTGATGVSVAAINADATHWTVKATARMPNGAADHPVDPIGAGVITYCAGQDFGP